MMLDTIVTAPLERKIATLETCVAALETRVAELETKLEYMKVLASADGQRIAELEKANADLDSQNLLMCAKSDVYYCDDWLQGHREVDSAYADGYNKASIEARRAEAAKIVRELGELK